MNVVVVGAGRMGQRHLQALASTGAGVHAVDPRPAARDEAVALGAVAHPSLDDALSRCSFDAAVLAETAAGRLERVETLVRAGIPQILIEKPLEQSRARVRSLAEAVSAGGVDARVNHFLRTLPLFRELRDAGGPFQLSVVGGAFGLACNGIHWLDLALYLGGDEPGRLLYGELDAEPVASGRGPEFCDYGGRALFALGAGTRLFLSAAAGGSAPMQVTIVQPTRETVLFPHESRAELAVRDPRSTKPPYLYGADYDRDARPALTAEELLASTGAWARAIEHGAGHRHPSVAAAVPAHELLFDLLESGGGTHFPVT